MREAATTVGYFDLKIADLKAGRLIYTVQKEVDFTTSLQFGPYRDSSVASAVVRTGNLPIDICGLPSLSKSTNQSSLAVSILLVSISFVGTKS